MSLQRRQQKPSQLFLLLEQQLLKHSTWENALIRCFLEIFFRFTNRCLQKPLRGSVQVLTEHESLVQPGCQLPLGLQPGLSARPTPGLPSVLPCEGLRWPWALAPNRGKSAGCRFLCHVPGVPL